ncbi:MAG: SDR family NAD(P)-dependent oxidoreductase [Bacteroidetes bacterium]|nr:SDR family NAD(P)-dependent oxidoreductase [Bacteroidota bacterium]
MMNNEYNGLEIAVIGMSGQFPGSDNPAEFWSNLREGRESVTVFSDEELRAAGVPEPLINSDTFVKACAVMKAESKNTFDYNFFGYGHDEAKYMDPQIRLFHEHCWKALEDAGYAADTEKKRIALFAGASKNYNWKMYVYSKSADISMDPFYLDMISSPSFISTLVSYKMNLDGPSMFVDTACSTSLAAIGLACKSLWFGEARMALAGGSSVSTQKSRGYIYQEGMINSADGHCRAFDKDASGTVGGEGVGVVVLKKLTDALKDRDHIYCVIKSISVNNDGHRKVGYTAPSVKGQADCIKMAQRLAGINPADIRFVETHGTGTRLGDPVEIRALTEAFGIKGNPQTCAIGAVKTNIGHLDSAAGVAGFMKAALSLYHNQIPPSLNYTAPNPEINFDEGPFYVNTQLKNIIKSGDKPVRAAVSSFGIGGTNVHAILESPPVAEPGDKGRTYSLITVSAKTEASLEAYLQKLVTHVKQTGDLNTADMAYSLQTGRKQFAYRKSFVVSGIEELLLLANEPGFFSNIVRSADRKPLPVLMCSGAGSQYPNMGRGLYQSEKVFRENMDRGFSLLRNLTGEDYLSIMMPDDADDVRINQMIHTQPAIFLFGYSLARLILSWGIQPSFLIGHSIGEYVAACIAGIFSFEDALQLVVKRGQLMHTMGAGAMVSVSINESDARNFTNDKITLAAINGPEQVVFSGDESSVEALMEQLSNADISFVKLYASQAGHSVMIDKILDEYELCLKKATINRPIIPVVSNLTGEIIDTNSLLNPEYWLRHMRETVQFSAGITKLLSLGKELVFIEAGGGHSLTTLVLQHKGEHLRPKAVNLIRHATRESDHDQQYLLSRTGDLWNMGLTIDWTAFYEGERRYRVPLPGYCFEKNILPTEVDPFESGLLRSGFTNAGASNELSNWIYYPVWKTLPTAALPHNEEKGNYLFFSNDTAFDEKLKASLMANGVRVTEVICGTEYKDDGQDVFTINPVEPSQFERLFTQLKRQGTSFAQVIYAWGINAKGDALRLEENNREVNLVFLSMVHIIKIILRDELAGNLRVTILTDSLYRITGHEKIRAEQSLLLGLFNTMPRECAVSSRIIDLELLPAHEADIRLLAEELKRTSKEPVLAIRNRQRWKMELEKNESDLRGLSSPVKHKGTYLITGGLGNLGMVLSEWLIRNYKARLIITGRKELPYENPKPDPAHLSAMVRLKRLQALSSDIIYISADVADLNSLTVAVDQMYKQVDKIDGIINLAGNIDLNQFELIEDITAVNVFSVWAPKVIGIRNLFSLFNDRNLDFVWNSSSLASILGGLGYSAYASANAFIDSFTMALPEKYSGWKSAGLGEMLFSEEEINNEIPLRRIGMVPEEITTFFEWSLSLEYCPHVFESASDLVERYRNTYTPAQATQAVLENNTSMVKAERPQMQVDYAEPESPTEVTIAAMVADFFALEKVGVDDNFFELGGDSLKAMILLKRLKKEFGVNIPLKTFFSLQNIRQIAAEIDEIRWINSSNEKQYVSII